MQKSGLAIISSEIFRSDANADTLARVHDDLDREVYCILGMPIDAVNMRQAVQRIDAAVAKLEPFLLTTTNANFLVTSLTSWEFRESLFMSDLCTVDGMPIVWIARLMGIPIKQRIAGSDMFEALKNTQGARRPIKAFWFGASEDVAAAASDRLNRSGGGVSCVGWINPGFGPLEELCQERFVDQINASGADFVVAALGAKKGQLWLRLNHPRLRVPIRAHLGAVINFEAGTVKRAPKVLRRWGLEWAWRVKEEPHLFGRYWHDGLVLLGLLMTRVLPLAAFSLWLDVQSRRGKLPFAISTTANDDAVIIQTEGYATLEHVAETTCHFRTAAASRKPVTIDLTCTRALDARFFGLILMLRKQVRAGGLELRFSGARSHVKRLFRLNGLGDLLAA